MRTLIGIIAALCCSLALGQASSWPSRPVKFVVPYPPGGGTDLVARAIGERLGSQLGQPFVIENRPGASEIIGTEAVVRSPADGHTLLLMSNTLAINLALREQVPYDAERDLAPVTRLVNVPFALLLHPSVKANSVKDLVALAKSQPGTLNAAHIGLATPHHLTLQWFRLVTGADITPVPYKGAGPALTAVVAGEVQMIFAGMGGATPHIKAGRLRPIAVTSGSRVPSAPELPTVAEAGYPDIDMTAWYGVMVPAGTPAPVVQQLHASIASALSLPEVSQRFLAVGMEAAPSTPQEFARLIRRETQNWKKVVDATGIKSESK